MYRVLTCLSINLGGAGAAHTWCHRCVLKHHSWQPCSSAHCLLKICVSALPHSFITEISSVGRWDFIINFLWFPYNEMCDFLKVEGWPPMIQRWSGWWLVASSLWKRPEAPAQALWANPSLALQQLFAIMPSKNVRALPGAEKSPEFLLSLEVDHVRVCFQGCAQSGLLSWLTPPECNPILL